MVVRQNLTGVPDYVLSEASVSHNESPGQEQISMNQNLFLSNVAEVKISYSTNVEPSDQAKITCSKDGAELFRQIFPDFEHREYFYVMLLNRGNRVLVFYQISVGGISGIVVDVKLILQAAIKTNCSGILLTITHPDRVALNRRMGATRIFQRDCIQTNDFVPAQHTIRHRQHS
jgi:DNA repair protein RadC